MKFAHPLGKGDDVMREGGYVLADGSIACQGLKYILATEYHIGAVVPKADEIYDVPPFPIGAHGTVCAVLNLDAGWTVIGTVGFRAWMNHYIHKTPTAQLKTAGIAVETAEYISPCRGKWVYDSEDGETRTVRISVNGQSFRVHEKGHLVREVAPPT